jgi:hypothetical protein
MDDRDARLASEHQADADDLPPPATTQTARLWEIVALVASFAVVIGGVALLPFVIRSMVTELGSGQDDTLYDLITGEPLTPGENVDPNASEYLNIAAIDLDERASAITLAISGNRVCTETCPDIELTFLALDDDATGRRGVPPFARASLDPEHTMYSETIQLPVRGTTVRYPFDTYELWLGIANPPADEADGETPPARPAGSPFTATLQNQIPQLVMAPPVPIDPSRVTAQTGRLTLSVVQRLTFRRPEYLQVLTATLVLLVAASSALALLTQPIDTLLLGVGGLILAIWGVRSVLTPENLPVVTAVNLALAGVILLLLIGLAARIALHLYRQRGIRLAWSRRRG